jgi:hypothetical protein
MALRYGAVAAVGFAAARMAPRGDFPPAVQAEMDNAPEGLHLRRAPGQINASASAARTTRLGRFGLRFRVDATALARLRIRRLT